jgi:hypothetical protein
VQLLWEGQAGGRSLAARLCVDFLIPNIPIGRYARGSFPRIVLLSYFCISDGRIMFQKRLLPPANAAHKAESHWPWANQCGASQGHSYVRHFRKRRVKESDTGRINVPGSAGICIVFVQQGSAQ